MRAKGARRLPLAVDGVPRPAKGTTVLVIAVALTALLSGCGLQQSLDNRSDVAGHNPALAPALTGTTLDGRAVTPNTATGRVVLLDFWASWCGPCRAEQADVNSLVTKFAARGVVFMGVDMRDDRAAGTAFRRVFGVGYESIDDPSGSLSAAYDVAAPPTVIIIDRNGAIALRLLGTVVGASDVLSRLAPSS